MKPSVIDLYVCLEALKVRRHVPFAMLVGAGFSASAKVPLALEMSTNMREAYPARFKNFASTAYLEVASRVAEEEWMALFGKDIYDAPVNFAHLCLAELMARGRVNRVLTTNFDGLLVRACSLVRAPFADFDCSLISDPSPAAEDSRAAIFHLHGRIHGLGLANSSLGVESRSKLTQSLIRRTVANHALVVCGQSGATDGILNWFFENDEVLRNPVYWIPYSADDVKRWVEQAETRVESPEKRQIWLTACEDADRLMFRLLRALDVEIPRIVRDRHSLPESLRAQIVVPPELNRWMAEPPEVEPPPPILDEGLPPVSDSPRGSK